MDILHPEILLQHSIQPVDYKNGLVFRSAIESIRGTFIASSTSGREGLIKDVLENMKKRNVIADYKQNRGKRRYDFTVQLCNNPDTFACIEVKGGEGNSINISERPLWAKEFAIWSHLDGAIVNQPAHGAHSILNRITNELVRRKKQVDALFFKDILCGTRTRPCPKYSGQEEKIGLAAAPDVFLMPQVVPSADIPEPPVHTLDTLQLPRCVLALFGVAPAEMDNHVWYIHLKLIRKPDGRFQRELQVRHKGKIVDQSKSRSWRE
ncbi:hypothetical protein [Desulfonema ishimotonii]|uniref:hypothetical protein n=1 Tax=Desulfonema ishimotonii TaxID=45657 RepID=UPI000F579EAD|nr:hypothetical protein [Desulfonema ishimotonii]